MDCLGVLCLHSLCQKAEVGLFQGFDSMTCHFLFSCLLASTFFKETSRVSSSQFVNQVPPLADELFMIFLIGVFPGVLIPAIRPSGRKDVCVHAVAHTREASLLNCHQIQ